MLESLFSRHINHVWVGCCAPAFYLTGDYQSVIMINNYWQKLALMKFYLIATWFQNAVIFISARCNIYISRLCYDVSVRLSVRLSVMEVGAL